MTIEDPDFSFFADRIGTAFELVAGEDRFPFLLESAEEIAGSLRAKGGFRLEFLGPVDPSAAQGVFTFAAGDDRVDIFIVAIARDASGTRYEAVYF